MGIPAALVTGHHVAFIVLTITFFFWSVVCQNLNGRDVLLSLFKLKCDQITLKYWTQGKTCMLFTIQTTAEVSNQLEKGYH